MVEVTSPISGKVAEVSHLPIIIEAIAVTIDAAKSQQENIATIVEISWCQIAGEALENDRAPIRGQQRCAGGGVPRTSPLRIKTHQHGGAEQAVANEDVGHAVGIILNQITGLAGENNEAAVGADLRCARVAVTWPAVTTDADEIGGASLKILHENLAQRV